MPNAEQRALRPVEKPHAVRRLGAVDVAALAEQVARLSETVWEKENAAKENDFFCFAHTRHIVFRFVAASRSGCFYSMPIWTLWRRWLLPVMAQAAAPYGYATPLFPKAMLARLRAGHGIEPHQDSGGMNPLTHKIHVPLQTGPRATLTVRGQTLHLPAGEAFEVNNLATHGAFNGEPQDRVHLVFEVFEGAGMEWRERSSTRDAMSLGRGKGHREPPPSPWYAALVASVGQAAPEQRVEGSLGWHERRRSGFALGGKRDQLRNDHAYRRTLD